MRRLLSSVFLMILSAIAHWVVARWALELFPRLARFRRWIVVATAGLVVLLPIERLLAVGFRTDWASRLFAYGLTEMMFMLLGALPLGLMRLTLRLVPRGPLPAPPLPNASAPLTRRQALERGVGFAVLATTTTTLGWGMARGRHAFAIEEVVVRIVGLPRALEGYTIAQISDIHTGLFVGERELDEGFARVREVRPDLVVATGDLVDFDASRAPLLARKLMTLSPRDGVVAIVGNHDYYAGADEVARAMRGAGIDLLINQGRVIRPLDGGGFALLGVDDLWARRAGGAGPDLGRALAMVPPSLPRILLAHQPDYFLQSSGKVALQLSGHTHGGQINPGFRPADLLMRFVAGRYTASQSTLWVNRGFGVVGPPARIGAPPEVTKVVLIAG